VNRFAHDGGKLRLREFGPGDAADIQALHADPRVRALLTDEQPLHEAPWAEAFTARLVEFYRRHPGRGIWRCGLPLDDGAERFAGWFSLMPMPASPETEAELGSRLLPEHWGSGLALAGGEVLLQHAFDTLGLAAVWGICHPDNRNAHACLQALGFAPHGRALYEGQLCDHHRLDAATWSRVQSLTHRQRLRHQRRASSSPAPLHP
jgi:RimJ/RimL family protein N-acetyltransferase